MSLGIAFKGPEGIVLAADSRVTLHAEGQVDETTKIMMPATFDNATKLLQVSGQDDVGVVTYGLGALGQKAPRTAHGFIPEFESQLAKEGARLSVEDFAEQLSNFFVAQWKSEEMPPVSQYQDSEMTFLVGGYDEDSVYGRVFRFSIPRRPKPEEQQRGNSFGVTWGGQLKYTTRLLKGFDPDLPSLLQQHMNLSDEQITQFTQHLRQNLSSQIPYQFLSLQDCVDLSVFLISTTMELQKWIVDVRGVGGAIDVATITRTEGFQYIEKKKITARRQ